MKPEIADAILALHPTNSFVLRDNNYSQIEWSDTPESPSTKKQVDDKLTELIAEWDAQEYARNRQPLYPDIGDQLDDLYHKGAFSAEMIAKLKKVKDDNPK